MEIKSHLKKPYWVRQSFGDDIIPSYNPSDDYVYPEGSAKMGQQYLTQYDFLSEISPNAHKVNSKYTSMRPVYEAVGEVNGKTKWEITGYEPMEKVSLGLQRRIADAKTSHFAHFWIANETNNKDAFDKIISYKDSVGLDYAFQMLVKSCFTTGDGAIYLYRYNGNIEYKVFSKLFGDDLYVEMDKDRNQVVYRKYCLNGRTAVDIFTTETHETWVMDDVKQGDDSWFDKIKSWFKSAPEKLDDAERSDDGFVLLSRTKAQLHKGLNQVVYWRIPDIPSGVAQQSIETLERICSFLAEEFKSTAIPILVLKAIKMNSMPPIGSHGRVLGFKGTADELAKSDAHMIAPPDASNIATITIDNLVKDIIRTTMSVFVDENVFKTGDPSSTAIKILFTPEIMWCQNMQPYFFQGLKTMVEVFKLLVWQVDEDENVDYTNMRLSCGFDVWIPQNQTEEEKRVLDKTYARLISRDAAMSELGNKYLGDYERIRQEWIDELDIKTRIPKTAEAEVNKEFGLDAANETVVVEGEETNPEAPKIDNNSKGKSIAER